MARPAGRTPRREAGDSVPLTADNLTLRIERLSDGRLAPAIVLRVYANGGATSVGMTVPAQYAERLADIIRRQATRSAEEAMFAPRDAPGHGR